MVTNWLILEGEHYTKMGTTNLNQKFMQLIRKVESNSMAKINDFIIYASKISMI